MLKLNVLDQLPVFHGSRPEATVGESLQLASATEAGPVVYAKPVQELNKLMAVNPEDSYPVAVPVVRNTPETWVMASGMRSALVAAARGLPLNLAHFINGENASMAAAAYRVAFVPSQVCPTPRISLDVRVTCADSCEEAEALGYRGFPMSHFPCISRSTEPRGLSRPRVHSGTVFRLGLR